MPVVFVAVVVVVYSTCSRNAYEVSRCKSQAPALSRQLLIKPTSKRTPGQESLDFALQMCELQIRKVSLQKAV